MLKHVYLSPKNRIAKFIWVPCTSRFSHHAIFITNANVQPSPGFVAHLTWAMHHGFARSLPVLVLTDHMPASRHQARVMQLTVAVWHGGAGSVLVLKGNGADVAQHCIPPVSQPRMSITLRCMAPRFKADVGAAVCAYAPLPRRRSCKRSRKRPHARTHISSFLVWHHHFAHEASNQKRLKVRLRPFQRLKDIPSMRLRPNEVRAVGEGSTGGASVDAAASAADCTRC